MMKEYNEALDKTLRRLMDNQDQIDSPSPDMDKIRATMNNSNSIINLAKTKIQAVRLSVQNKQTIKNTKGV